MVFDLGITFLGVINEWMQESESDYHQKHRVQFKDQGFLAGNSCIIEINSCEKCHRKKLPDLITRGWVKKTRTQTHPPSPLSKRKKIEQRKKKRTQK